MTFLLFIKVVPITWNVPKCAFYASDEKLSNFHAPIRLRPKVSLNTFH